MVMMIILSVVMTGLVMTVAWAAAVQTRDTATLMHSDEAYAAAESAGQAAVWQFKHNNSWRQAVAPGTLPTLTIGGSTYTYALTCADAGASANLDWPFQEGSGLTTADISVNHNTGTLIGGVTWTTQGRFTNGLVFDGVSGYVDAGNAPSTNITGSVTMAAWVKMNSADQDQKVGGNQDGVAGGYKMSVYGTRVEFEVRDTSNNPWLNRSVGGGTVMTMGVWYHLTGVYNTSTNTIRTYVNGILDRELTGVPANSLGSTAGNFRMGREPWNVGGNTRYFNGMINDVRVYSRALSDQEIKALADTSVQLNVKATLQNASYPYPPSNSVAFVCSVPTPLPPVAPAVTVGGNWALTYATVSGDVQVDGAATGASTSVVNGKVIYGSSYTDTNHKITINGTPTTPTQNASATVPTINYANMQAQASSTGTSGTGQTYSFGYLANQINLIYVNGNVTDPVIDTSQSGGTLLINGTLTLTKTATFGTNGFPAYIVVQKSVSHTGGTITINGALYVGTTLTHKDWTINGLLCVAGNVTDNTSSASSYAAGGIPWFDPRSSAAATPQALYFTSCRGVAP